MNKGFVLAFLCCILLLTTASAEFFTTPDVNVVSPMAGERYHVKDTILITVSVEDSDTNTSEMTIDLNFSTSQTQGTGTIILDGVNLWADLVCDSNNLFIPRECTYSWNTIGVSTGTYYITTQITDANSEVDFNAGIDSFSINATDVNINLTTFGNLFNKAAQVVERVTFGVQLQGDLIGLAIGIALAVGLFMVMIISILGIIPQVISKIKEIR